MGNPFSAIARFLQEVKGEMKKVTWLNRGEVVQYTIAVLVISAVVGAYLGAFDFLFQKGFEYLRDSFS